MSISVAVLPEPGAPQVGVTVTDLSSPATISIQRSWKADEWWSVIGAVEVEAFGSYFTRDFLPPLNVPVTYRVVVHSGTITGDEQVSLTVPSDDMWLQDPRDPRGAVRVTCEHDEGRVLLFGSFASAQYRQAMDLAVPLGARQPVASLGQRLLAGDVPLRVTYDVANEGGELQRLLMDSGELVLRGHHFTILDAVATIAVGDASEEREQIYAGLSHPMGQISIWNLSVTSVRSTALQVAIAWWTYQQCEALWVGASYADALAARPGDTYLDWQADPTQP